MPGNVGTGWGKYPWGHAPWGTVNWAEEHFDLIPPEIQKDDEQNADGNQEKFELSVGPLFNDLLNDKILKFTDLVDPDSIPIELLPKLGKTYSIELEEILSDRAQRSFVRNGVKWMALKGTALAYTIRANLSGFAVEVLSLFRMSVPITAVVALGRMWEIPAGSGNFYTDLVPLQTCYDCCPADVVPTDTYSFQLTSGQIAALEALGCEFRDATTCGYCKTSSIRVLISEEDLDLQPGASVAEALAVIVSRLGDVKPTHVRILQVAFSVNLAFEFEVDVDYETFNPTENEPVVF